MYQIVLTFFGDLAWDSKIPGKGRSVAGRGIPLIGLGRKERVKTE